MAPQVFFITGASTGFGSRLVQKALEKGDKVAATARNSAKLSFPNTTKANYIAIDCDVTIKSSIDNALQTALDHFGRIDVVVNNAGYGAVGVFESISDAQVEDEMNVNFYGVVNVTRRALKIMREVNNPPGGKIIQISSIWGQTTVPYMSIYCASKFAVSGFTDALSKELKPEWNIKLCCIEPGGFRTDWAGRSAILGEQKAEQALYDHLDVEKYMDALNGSQPGDPAKAASVFWELAQLETPPVRVVVGTDAWTDIMEKLEADREMYSRYEKWCNSTDVDA